MSDTTISMREARLAKARRFQALHAAPEPLVIASAWDAGTARILDLMGFKALSTTTTGLAFSLGRQDRAGRITCDEAIANAKAIAEATDLPVAADLENGFGHSPACVARTISLAGMAAGLVGGSIGDTTGDCLSPVYEFPLAVERVAAAVEASRRLPFPFVLVARTESYRLGGRHLDNTISRLRAFEAAGADVLSASGLLTADEIRAVCGAVNRPVAVTMRWTHAEYSVAELAALGARRINVGSGLCRAAITAVVNGARELRAYGTCGFAESAIPDGTLNALMRSRLSA